MTDWQPVVSSSLKAVRYDAANRTLQIKFVKDTVYEYYEVPEKVYQELLNADSKGSYFRNSIKSFYFYDKLK